VRSSGSSAWSTPSTLTNTGLAVLEGADRLAAERGHGLGGQRRALPEALAEVAEVGLGLERDERVAARRPAHLLDVELRREQARERVQLAAHRRLPAPTPAPGATGDELAERLADVDPDGLARRAAEVGEAAHALDRRVERRVERDRLPVAHVRGEVDALAVVEPAGERAVQPVGEERREGREQPRRHEEHLVQRRERGARVGRRLAPFEPEARARQPHVPLAHVGVEELHHAPRGRRRVVRGEQRVGVALRRREAAQHPPVERGPRAGRRVVGRRRPAEVRVLLRRTRTRCAA
jgi:hypothetical protein